MVDKAWDARLTARIDCRRVSSGVGAFPFPLILRPAASFSARWSIDADDGAIRDVAADGMLVGSMVGLPVLAIDASD